LRFAPDENAEFKSQMQLFGLTNLYKNIHLVLKNLFFILLDYLKYLEPLAHHRLRCFQMINL